MKRLLKWTACAVATIAFVALCVFLYVMPPFLITPPERFTQTLREAAPPVDGIADPATRVIAQRGRDIVLATGCIGCHSTNGDQGPDYTKYLAGGSLKFETRQGTFVSRNLTPDVDTGLASRSDEDVKRVLRSGVFPDGHVAPHTVMPWATFSNWTEEDRHAVVTYLRHIPPVRHRIPDPDLTPVDLPQGILERDFGMKDYGVK